MAHDQRRAGPPQRPGKAPVAIMAVVLAVAMGVAEIWVVQFSLPTPGDMSEPLWGPAMAAAPAR